MGLKTQNYGSETSIKKRQHWSSFLHLCKTFMRVQHPVFHQRFPKGKSVMHCENDRCLNGKWSESGAENQRGGTSNHGFFLPDHFLYRGVVRTVLRFLGGVGGVENTKDKSWTVRPTVDTFNEKHLKKIVWEVISKNEVTTHPGTID